jgi:Spy/CpxP family protein refolding chaperone
LFKPLLLLALVFIPVSAALAQETTPTPAGPGADKPVDFRTNALRQLGLSRDQLQRIRVLNQERKPLMDAAQVRLRQANRALDEMIYADNATDTDVQTRLKDFQMAQAEVAKIRFLNELGVRRILTQDQLNRFRRLRERFEATRAADRGMPASLPRTGEPQRPLRQVIRQNLKKP